MNIISRYYKVELKQEINLTHSGIYRANRSTAASLLWGHAHDGDDQAAEFGGKQVNLKIKIAERTSKGIYYAGFTSDNLIKAGELN